MNLFRRHKKFEDQLKEQLGDMGYKPSESLWDRIDSGIPEDGFEPGIQQSLENFEQVPYSETWEKIAARLPKEKTGDTLFKYYGIALLTLLLFTGYFVGYKLTEQTGPAADLATATGLEDATIRNTSSSGLHGNTRTGDDLAEAAPGTKKNAGDKEGMKVTTLTETATPELPDHSAPAGGRKGPAPVSDRPGHQTALEQPGHPAEKHSKDALPVPSKDRRILTLSHSAKRATVNTGNKSVAGASAVKEHVTGQYPAMSLSADKRNLMPAKQRGENIAGSSPVSAAHTRAQTAASRTAGDGKLTGEVAGLSSSGGNSAAADAGNEQYPGGSGSSSGAAGNDVPVVGSIEPPKNIPAGVKAEQESVRVLAEVAPDSTINTKTYEPVSGPQGLSPVSISIFTGAQLCFTTYDAPANFSSRFENNIALRKKLERPDIDWSGAFLVDVRLSEKWMLSTGIMMTNFSQKFDYGILPAVNPGHTNEPGASLNNPNDSVVTGSTYNNRIKYSWTEIPLLLNYTVANKRKIKMDMQAGLSYAFINTVDAGIISYDNKGVFVLKNKDAFPQINSTIFVSVLPQVSYKFSEELSLGIVPSFKYSLTSIIGNTNWVQQHPYFIGMNLCLRKRF